MRYKGKKVNMEIPLEIAEKIIQHNNLEKEIKKWFKTNTEIDYDIDNNEDDLFYFPQIKEYSSCITINLKQYSRITVPQDNPKHCFLIEKDNKHYVEVKELDLNSFQY